MIVKTQGLVLNHIDHRETSIIVKLFTKNFGYQGYVVNSVRSAKSKQGMAYFQPLTILDMVTYMKPNRDLYRISEFKPVMIWNSQDVKKQSVLLFLTEILNKLLRNEQSENIELFDYLLDSLRHLKSLSSIENFHLVFLLKMTPYLGITINSGEELFRNMNLISDQVGLEGMVNELLNDPFSRTIQANGDLRFSVLEALMLYFRHHVSGFGDVLSLKVLRQIFR